MRVNIRKICVGLLIASLVAIPIVANTTITPVVQADPGDIPLELDTPSIPLLRTYWIGVLQGTWEEMGIQYGERTANYIQQGFDSSWKSILKVVASTPEDYMYPKGYGPLIYVWPEGVETDEEKIEYILETVRENVEDLNCLSPEMIEFMEGIAEGAEEALGNCKYADVCSDFEKIAVMNLFSKYFLYGPPEGSSGSSVPEEGGEGDCCGFWIKDGATTGDTFGMSTYQHNYRSGETHVSFVAIPKDPNARVFWGCWYSPGKISGRTFNDCGVFQLNAGGQYYDGYADLDETVAPGTNEYLLATWAIIFSETAEEAAEKFTVGTPEYRALTGNKIVPVRRGINMVFADANDCYCVERNAKHYAIREPGYMGEEDSSYLSYSNHFVSKEGSFDENNVWNEDEPMWAWTASKDVPGWVDGGWEPDFEGLRTTYEGTSYWRFWSSMWAIYNNYGNIDLEMVLRELSANHAGYDEDGNCYLPDEYGCPTICNTVCDHYLTPGDHDGYQTKEEPLGKGGNTNIGVFVPNKLEVYWVEGWPCHYIDKEWNYVNLKPYSQYRNLLYGPPYGHGPGGKDKEPPLKGK